MTLLFNPYVVRVAIHPKVPCPNCGGAHGGIGIVDDWEDTKRLISHYFPEGPEGCHIHTVKDASGVLRLMYVENGEHLATLVQLPLAMACALLCIENAMTGDYEL